MADPQKIELSYDTSDSVAELKKFGDALRAQGKDLSDYASIIIKSGTTLEEYTVTAKRVADAETQIQEVFKKSPTGWDLTSSAVRQNTKALEDNATAAAKLVSDAATKAGVSSATSAAFPAPTTTNVASILTYNNAISRLQNVVVANNVPLSTFNSLLTAAARSPAAFAAAITSLPPNLQATATAISQVSASLQQAGNAGAAAGRGILISWAGIFRLFEAQALHRTIGELINLFTTGIRTAFEFQTKLQQVAGITNQAPTALEANIRGLSETFGVGQVEVLTASQKALTSQAGDTAAGLNVLTQALKLSKASGIDLAASTNLVSSSLNAFKLSGIDSVRVANDLYLAAQKSRIPLDELQSAIGRVGPTAQQLGVSFETTLSAFLTLAQTGARPSESFALLTQVMGRLLAPTKELRAVFQSWGTPTGEAAIATFGFAGTLQKLHIEAEKSPERLSEIAGSLRALRGLLPLLQSGFDGLNNNVKEFQNNLGALDTAASKVLATPAQQLQKQLNEIQISFVDLGKNILTGALGFANLFGGLPNILGNVTSSLKGVIATMLVYQAASAVARASTISMTTQLSGMGLMATATQVRVNSLTAALSGLSATTAVTAGFGIGFVAGELFNKIEEDRTKGFQDQIDKIKKGLEKSKEDSQKLYAEETEAFKTELNKRTQTSKDELAKQVQEAILHKNKLVETFKDLGENVKLSSIGLLDSLQRDLSKVTKDITESHSAIDAAKKSSISGPDKIQQTGFQQLLGFTEDLFTKNTLLKTRLQEINREREKLLQSTEKEDIAARRLLDSEIQRVTFEIRANQIAQQKQYLQQHPEQAEKDEKGNLVLRVSQAQQQLIINQLKRQEVEADNILIQNQKKKIEALEIEKDTRKQNLKAVQDALLAVERFKVFDISGKLTPEFKGQSAADIEKRFDALSGKAIFTAVSAGQDPTALRLSLQLQKQGITQILQADAALKNTELRQQGLNEAQANLIKLEQEAVRLRNEGSDIISSQSSKIRELATALQQVKTGVTLQGLGNAFISPVKSIEDTKELNRLEAQVAATAKSIGFAQANKDLKEVEILNERLLSQLNELKAKASSFGVDLSKVGVPLAGGQSVQATIDRAFELQKNLSAGLAQANRAPVNVTSEALAGIGTKFNDVGVASQLAAATINSGFDSINEKIRSSISFVEAYKAALNSINLKSPLVGPTRPEGFASGGVINGRGTDTIPIMASPGEFIINSASTSKFYSQLVDINRGMQPRYFAQGGPVTVGDVNVTVNGGDTSERTIREIGVGLRRELKRGTISWK